MGLSEEKMTSVGGPEGYYECNYLEEGYHTTLTSLFAFVFRRSVVTLSLIKETVAFPRSMKEQPA
jgi:hypothetical protein